MRLILFSLILAASFSLATAQTKTDLVPNDHFPERWKEFSLSGQYRVLFPDTPKESTTAVATALGEMKVHSVNYKSFISYAVTSTQYPSEIETKSNVKSFMDYLRDGSLAAVASVKPKVVSESDFTLDGHPGRLLQIEFADDTVVRFKWIAVKDRVYVLHVTTPKSRAKVTGSENDYEKIANTFLDSFRLLK